MSSDYPRINLDSSKHLAHVEQSYAQVLHDIARESRAGSKKRSAFDEQVDVVLRLYLKKTFDLARPNLRVNGQDYEESIKQSEDLEPFNESYRARMTALEAEIDALQTRMAERRRTVPLELERVHAADVARWRTVDERVRALVEEEERAAEEERKAREEGKGPVPTLDEEAVETFNTTAAQISASLSILPAQLSKMEQAQSLRSEIESLES